KGAFLFLAMQRGFEAISDGVSQLRNRPETVDVTIATTTAISSLWLTPKMPGFWKLHPEITVSQIISDVPVNHGRCDLSVHYGDPRGDDLEYRELFQDHIVALGTARFAAEHTIKRV